MTTHTATPTVPNPTPRRNFAESVVVPMPTRHAHRERDFGVGYGSSSGYASPRRYVSDWAMPRFKFA